MNIKFDFYFKLLTLPLVPSSPSFVVNALVLALILLALQHDTLTKYLFTSSFSKSVATLILEFYSDSFLVDGFVVIMTSSVIAGSVYLTLLNSSCLTGSILYLIVTIVDVVDFVTRYLTCDFTCVGTVVQYVQQHGSS